MLITIFLGEDGCLIGVLRRMAKILRGIPISLRNLRMISSPGKKWNFEISSLALPFEILLEFFKCKILSMRRPVSPCKVELRNWAKSGLKMSKKKKKGQAASAGTSRGK